MHENVIILCVILKIMRYRVVCLKIIGRKNYHTKISYMKYSRFTVCAYLVLSRQSCNFRHCRSYALPADNSENMWTNELKTITFLLAIGN